MNYRIIKKADQPSYLEVSLSDYALVSDPFLNKGMAFTNQERDDFYLHGLLPNHTATIQEQSDRSYEAFSKKANDLEKYIYLRDLQDSNEVLFYHLVCNHIEELLPIIYTPTVGLGCQQLSHIYRRPRGLYIAYPNRDRMDEMLANPRFDSIEVIVVSDGERILGLGDQGAGGMGIPIGKLSLYCACAGINPASALPILLDTGTNNPERIDDPLYIGWKNPRVRGQEYDDFIDVFIKAVKKRFPHVLLQWEDFAQQNATRLLEKYQDELCTFNDDIQGTAAVAAGTLLAAVHASKTNLSQQKIVILGAGSAGCGIANLMMHMMKKEGLTEAQARERFYLVDRNGLLVEGMSNLLPFQQPFVRSRASLANWSCEKSDMISLLDVVKNAKPTVLVGVSGQPNTFTEAIVREMAAHCPRPIIFPLSNPTARSEAVPADLMRWTDNRAIIGTGSPFNPIQKNGKPFRVDQTNNAYIFPGMGLGLIAVKAKRVTEKMFIIAAKTLAECAPSKLNPDGNLLPELSKIREVSYKIAVAVAQEAVDSGLAEIIPKDVAKQVQDKIWVANYLPYRRMK